MQFCMLRMGRLFEKYGDANPQFIPKQIATSMGVNCRAFTITILSCTHSDIKHSINSGYSAHFFVLFIERRAMCRLRSIKNTG